MSEQKTVALDEVTHGRLYSYRARLEANVARNPLIYPVWMRGSRLSLDDAVSFLLDQQERHGIRTKEYKARKRAADKMPPLQEEEPWHDDDILSIPPEHLRPAGDPVNAG